MGKSNAIFVILFYLILIGLTAERLTAQSEIVGRKYSITFKNEPIDSVINQLERLVHLGFSYNPDILSDKIKVSKVFTQENLIGILDSVFLPNRLNYEIIGRNIAIGRYQKNLEVVTNSQEIEPGNRYFQMDGRIMDSVTNTPIAFANVYIKGKGIGNISNLDGYFILKIPAENKNDSVCFSCLGYKTVGWTIRSFTQKQMVIKLEPVSVMIKEVTVKYVDPHTLLKEAIEKIPKNYSKAAKMNTAFYRETVRENKNYVSLSEAILRIYKAAYNSYQNDQVIIFKGRRSPFVKQMDTLLFKFQGGLYTSLLLDIAKNHTNFLADEYLEYYDFRLDEITSVQDRATYVISFDQKDNAPYPLYKGKLFIDRKTLAFVKAEFMISPKGMDKAADDLVRKSPPRVKVKPIVAKYLVIYTNQNNIWSLSNIREELVFKVHKRLTFFNRTYNTVAELVITKTDSTDVHRFRIRDASRPDDIFVEKIGKYDEAFWGEYNFLKPDESLEEALKLADQKMKALREVKK